ncbi:hypothetical protein Mgra_00002823 [Meloidogyne graminicola]|uniref:TIL domain-containing protein n=1 Tax=Meloidogyne graminicola TaxID=189291 RepID=A0A8S9ZXJ4_9BILA|nr:hypothetical protein Mgra_00002823 [Meloidogyne graminicola]
MFFVFLSLVEFAAVNSYMREAEKYERLASYTAKKELHLYDDNSRWSPDESCGENSLLIFGVNESVQNGLGSRLISFANLLVPSLLFNNKNNSTIQSKKILINQNIGNGNLKQQKTDNLYSTKNKKVNLGLRLSEHMELRAFNDFGEDGGGEEELSESKSLPPSNHLLITSPTHNNKINNNFSPSENRRNIIIPEMHPWPPSPYEKGRGPPLAPRKARKTNNCINSNNINNGEQKCPRETNHFLRQGFSYSRKEMFILLILFIIPTIIFSSEEECGENKYVDNCFMRCQGFPPSCRYPRGLDIAEELNIECICEKACVCEDGYVRKDWTYNSECIPLYECPLTQEILDMIDYKHK